MTSWLLRYDNYTGRTSSLDQGLGQTEGPWDSAFPWKDDTEWGDCELEYDRQRASLPQGSGCFQPSKACNPQPGLGSPKVWGRSGSGEPTPCALQPEPLAGEHLDLSGSPPFSPLAPVSSPQELSHLWLPQGLRSPSLDSYLQPPLTCLPGPVSLALPWERYTLAIS